jgi:O-antigen/teichoic acid export membrane protein
LQSLKQLAGQTAIYGLSSILGRFLNYLLTPLYTYQFLAKEYGIVTEMYAYVAFLIVLLTFGMETAFFRFTSKEGNEDKTFSAASIPVISVSLLFLLLCLVFSQNIADLISYSNNPEFVSWFAIIISLDAISSIPMARLRNQNRAARFAWINLTSIGVNILLNLFFIAYCKVGFENNESNALIEFIYKPEIGVGYIFIANVISSSIRILLLSPEFLKIHFRVEWKDVRKMVLYSSPLLLAGLAGIANENIDRILLKYILLDDLGLDNTMAQIGIYGACYKVSILITLFVQAYRYAAEPFFFSKSGEEGAENTYAEMMRYFVLICLILYLALMMNLDWVMYFVGEEYRVGAKIVPVLLLANIMLGVYYNLSVWYKLTDKTRYAAYIAVFGAGVTLLANFILIPKIGYMGSAWATLMCYSTMVIISAYLGKKNFPISYPWKKLLAYLGLTLALILLVPQMPIPETHSWWLKNVFLVGFLALIVALERPKKMII